MVDNQGETQGLLIGINLLVDLLLGVGEFHQPLRFNPVALL